MSKPIIREHNLETNEIIDREMTNEEFAEYEEQKAKDQLAIEQDAARAAAKSAAEAKLEALGLTPDDLKALGL
jgi:hypothetical protein